MMKSARKRAEEFLADASDKQWTNEELDHIDRGLLLFCEKQKEKIYVLGIKKTATKQIAEG